MSAENTNQDVKINKTLRFSLIDGIFASVMSGLTQDYFAPFLLLLGASAQHIGILNAFPNLFASLIQLKSADIVEKMKSRRLIINIFVFLQAVVFLPMVIMAFRQVLNPLFFIFLVTIFLSLGAFAGPAWGSLMSDLVKENKRGQYFGWRNKVLGFMMVAAAFLAGFILHIMERINIFYGFVIIFGLAFLCRIISWCFLTLMHDPVLKYQKESQFTFFDFIKRVRESNFAKFVFFVAMFSFCVNLVSPFFSVLMLRDLKFSYFTYTVITVSATLTVYLMFTQWGRHADKIGNLKVVKFCAPLISVLPLFWVINRNPVFLIFTQIFAGFAWSGFNLCVSNFIYDAVTPEKRIRCIAYFNVINGTALCAGALVGGFLLTRLPPLFGYNILTLCIIASVSRLFVSLIMPFKLKEVRPVERIKNNQLFFSVIGIKPINLKDVTEI